jgi:two-component system, NtrC family, response regulator AtoC
VSQARPTGEKAEEATDLAKGSQDLPASDVELLVLHGRHVMSRSLPEHGHWIIGRSPDADVALDDPQISREHAVLHIGPPLCIEDRESKNGTRVNKVRIEAGRTVELRLGDVIDIGSAKLVVQAPPRPRTVNRGTVELGGREIIVADEEMISIHRLVERIASSDISLLLLGETGVGKEIIAEALHLRSPRAQKPFLRVSCVALPESLLESELFGHERGAFTGANQAKLGLLETADGGTVFLDEIGELPLSAQSKLLRVIESREVLRVGGLKPTPIDVRFVSATHRDLEERVQAGSFREDLYFRLCGFSLLIPPLRDRKAEIAPLARAFVSRACAATRRTPEPGISMEVIEILKRYSWPGNIRELRNVIERALVLCSGEVITPDHLPWDKMKDAPGTPNPAPAGSLSAPTIETPLQDLDPKRVFETLERQRIVEALERCAGNQTQAAKSLGMSRRTLVTKLDTYGLPRPRKGSRSGD